jgi:hypothetical protein
MLFLVHPAEEDNGREMSGFLRTGKPSRNFESLAKYLIAGGIFLPTSTLSITMYEERNRSRAETGLSSASAASGASPTG